MLANIIAGAKHGMMISNARIFSKSIGGRSNDDLLVSLADHGIRARCYNEHPLLSTSDLACGSTVILW
jgi:hypothetical protein